MIHELAIQKDDAVLLLWCWTWDWFEYIQNYLWDSWHLIGVDISWEMLSFAADLINHEQRKNITLVESDASQFLTWVSMKNQKFDVVICELSLSVMCNWKKVIKSSFHVLKDNWRFGLLDREVAKPWIISKLVNFFAQSECTRKLSENTSLIFGLAWFVKRYFFWNVVISVFKK